jgi:hypothetical protein
VRCGTLRKEDFTMTHSKNFDKVKKYYTTFYNGKRMWNEDRVRNAVVKDMITPDEFEEITGKEYNE